LVDLNRAKYSGADFNTHEDDLRARLQVKFAADYNDFALSAQGIMLLDLVAFGLSTLSFYLDRRATDTFLSTARTAKSAARTSRQLGYKMGGAISSGVDVRVTITTPKAIDITVPEGFQFAGPNDLIFEVAEAVTFTPGEQAAGTSKLIPCFEGETLNETFVSDGTPSQIFELRRVPEDKFVVQGSVTVLVDGATFDEVELLEAGQTDQFEVGFNDDPATVRFGDGLAGNIPTAGASIDVTYVAARGRSGQVAGGTIEEEVNPLVVAFETIGLDITNPNPASGGDDRESIASAQAYAPQVFKSRKAAITASDYDALASSYADPLFGRVAVARAISSRSADTDLTLQNLLADIDTAIMTFHPTITTQVTNATTALDALDVNLATVLSEANAITAALTTQDTAAATIETSLATMNAAQVKITTDLSSVATAVATIAAAITSIRTNTIAADALVEGYGPSGTSELTQPQVDAVTVLLDSIVSSLPTIESARDQISSDQATMTTQNTSLGTEITASTTNLATVRSQNTTADTAATAVVTAQGSASTNSGSIRTAVLAISAANTSVESDINTATAAIFTHVDLFLADDCKANLVTVPILTKDAGGFYVEPSLGLINSLQAYLDDRKEVTHTVSVTSGAPFLVLAVIVVRLGVFRGFSTEVVKTAALSAIDGILRDRAFGANLYEFDVESIIESVDGVRFANVSITGPAGKLDGDGNLIVLDSEVITKGTVTITPELVNETS
jgi:hypothetical protein